MGMELALTRHMPAVLEIETAAHMFYDEDFGVMALSEYAWDESDFYKNCNADGYLLSGYFSGSGKLLGFIVLYFDEITDTNRIIKLEVLRDGNEASYCNYILNWVKERAKKQIVFLTNEADDLKNYCLKGLGFKGELRRQAFRKMGRDGIWWRMTP